MADPVSLKVCGLTRPEDYATCVALGVDAIGLNLWARSRRGLTLEAARAVVAPGGQGGHRPVRVGVFVDADAGFMREAFHALSLDLVQPHDDGDPLVYALLGLPWVWVIRGTPELDSLRVPEPAPAWVLLDALVPGFGGAGRRTDWTWAARAVERLSPLPVWLAGGIRPENAAEAIDAVCPAGLDVASGAELRGATHGEKDPSRIRALLRACRGERDPGQAPPAS